MIAYGIKKRGRGGGRGEEQGQTMIQKGWQRNVNTYVFIFFL
jgi:hypothetical protein